MKAEPEDIEAALYWRDGDSGLSLPLQREEILIGRKSDCDLILPNQHVSRWHAKIVRCEGEYLLFDLGSTHGTFVSGGRVEVHVLRSGDSIELGKDRVPIEFRRKEHAASLEPSMYMSALSGVRNRQISRLVDVVLKSVQGRRELERELLLAEETQRTLLPHSLPEVSGYRLCAYSKPTRYVGGDFYDFFPDHEGSVCGVLGDVSGKGVSAALLSSMVIGTLQSQLRSGTGLEDAVSALNTILCHKPSDRFVTLFLFQLGSNGKGQFVNAGHNPAYVYRHNQQDLTELASNSIIVGRFDSAFFRSTEIDLDCGDMMLVYSDGLTEAENGSGEMLGEDRVRRLLQQESSAGAEHVKTALLNLIESFTDGEHQNDDITFVLIERI